MHDVQQQNNPRSILAGILITILLILGTVTTWLIPLPALYYRIKLGRKKGLIIPAAVILILILIEKGISADVIIASDWMFLGFLLSECFELGISKEKTILFSSLTVFLLGGLALFFYSTISHTGIYDLAHSQIKMLMDLFAQSGHMEKASEEIVHKVTCELPGMIAASTLLIAMLNASLAIRLLKRNQLHCPDYGILENWKTPEHLVWVVIFGAIGFLSHSSTFNVISVNVMYPVFLIYFFQGISIVSFFIKKTKIPVAFRYLLYFLLFLLPAVNFLVAGIGLFDMWVDFRKLSTKLTGNTGD